MNTFRTRAMVTRFLPIGLLAIGFLSGCGTSPADSESTRETVLKYLGDDAQVGTSGPFGRGGEKELDVLSPHDRQQAVSLVEHGAAMFLVFGSGGPAGGGASRIILVQRNRVVADFKAETKAAATR